jgi:hypothetical protein
MQRSVEVEVQYRLVFDMTETEQRRSVLEVEVQLAFVHVIETGRREEGVCMAIQRC